jgi:hypothetical protein
MKAIFVLLLASTVTAHAQTTTTYRQCTKAGAGTLCTSTVMPPGTQNMGGYIVGGGNAVSAQPSVISVDRSQSVEREKAWEARCKPEIRRDAAGIDRYVYAAPGCDKGE